MAFDLSFIDPFHQVSQNLSVRLNVNLIIRLGRQQRPHECQALRHEFRAVHLAHLLILHNTTDFPKRGADGSGGSQVPRRRGVRDEDILDRHRQVQRANLLHDILPMIHRVGGAHLLRKRRRLGP